MYCAVSGYIVYQLPSNPFCDEEATTTKLGKSRITSMREERPDEKPGSNFAIYDRRRSIVQGLSWQFRFLASNCYIPSDLLLSAAEQRTDGC